MNTCSTSLIRAFLGIAFITSACLAQDEQSSPSAGSTPPMPPTGTTTSSTSTGTSSATSTAGSVTGQPNEAEMMKQMVELAKLNENHKLLASLDGTWDYKVKFWFNGDPTSKPQESKGTAVRKSVMGGRFFTMDVAGKMQMPGADGKMKDVDFKGQGTEGYDNVKKKFVGTWMDNMGTSIMMAEGSYDPASKTFTYTAEMEPTPGMKQQIREVVKLTDKDHMMLEWYEMRGGQEIKTMEINYTRAKK